MKKNLTKFMMVVMMAILPLSFYAQKKQSAPVERYFYLFAEGGLSVNHTDLANYGGIPFNFETKKLDPYFLKNYDGQVGLGYQFGKVMGINAKFGTATLQGEKEGQRLTGFDAVEDPTLADKGFENVKLDKTTFMEANLNLTFNLTNLFFGYNPRRVFNFIPHLGIGGIRYHAGAVKNIADDTELLAKKDNAEMTFTVPVGAELNFNIARWFDFFIDYTFTWAGNDKLDQVQKLPDDIQVINDMYSSVNAGIRVKFNKKPCDIEKMAANAKDITMRVNPEPLQEENGKVCYDVIFNVPGEYFEKEAVMNITPTMTYEGGQVELTPVTFVGEKVKGQGDFQVNYKNGGEFTKHYCMDYVPGMENGKLIANPMFYVYDGTIYPTQEDIVKNAYFTQGGDRILTQGVLVPVVKCEVGNLKTVVDGKNVTISWSGDAETYDIYFGDGTPGEPTVAGVKETSYTFNDVADGKYNVYVKANCKDDNFGDWTQGTPAEIIPERLPIAIFYFDYNSADLKPNTKMNKEAAKALAEKLAAGEAINGFEIEGWASPEGELSLNNNLADNRADAAAKAIKNQIKKVKLNEKNFTFDPKGFGPDWDKFIELVQNSNIKDKDQIIRVINNAGSQARKEQEIKNMINVYPELEKHILPLIRRAEVFVK
jgi:outer membrane protein OmpA-like peptidoglycan-associated protein